jgi:protein-disulfide isomerase
MANTVFLRILTAMLLGFLFFMNYRLQNRISDLEHLLIEKSRRSSFNLKTDDKPRIGAIDAQLEVLVFSDYTCPHCKNLYEQIELLRADYIDTKKVSFVFYSYPLMSHDNSKLFAAVGKYGHSIQNFEPFYHRLFQKQDSLNLENIAREFADLVGDTVDFKNRITQTNQPEIENDIQIIKDFQIKGSPAFIINDQLHVGLKTEANMRSAIEAALLAISSGL